MLVQASFSIQNTVGELKDNALQLIVDPLLLRKLKLLCLSMSKAFKSKALKLTKGFPQLKNKDRSKLFNVKTSHPTK